MVKTREQRAAECKRIKTTYHCRAIWDLDLRPYVVEVKSPLLENAWSVRNWYFPTEQDAINYCKNETGNSPARVIFSKYVHEDNTIYPTLVYTKH